MATGELFQIWCHLFLVLAMTSRQMAFTYAVYPQGDTQILRNLPKCCGGTKAVNILKSLLRSAGERSCFSPVGHGVNRIGRNCA